MWLRTVPSLRYSLGGDLLVIETLGHQLHDGRFALGEAAAHLAARRVLRACGSSTHKDVHAIKHLAAKHALTGHDRAQGRRDGGHFLLDEVALRPQRQGAARCTHRRRTW